MRPDGFRQAHYDAMRRPGQAMRLMSPEEFEQWQLEGRMVFCRYCGLTRFRSVPMDVRPPLELDIDGKRRCMAVYICPDCGHAALSEIPFALEGAPS